jgi:hypothetical protein
MEATHTKTSSQYWQVGAHVGFGGSISETAYEAVSLGMNSFQFFLGNPKSF